MYASFLKVLMGLGVIIRPLLSSPVNGPVTRDIALEAAMSSPVKAGLTKRLTEPVCQEAQDNGLAPSYAQIQNLINSINADIDDETTFAFAPIGINLGDGQGAAIGFSSNEGTTEPLTLSVGSVNAYWTTILNACQVNGEVAGYQTINEDGNYWAWVNIE